MLSDMTAFEEGSPCLDCLSCGLQNYLKPFYIDIDEQIIKCESSRCMFPYILKPKSVPFEDTLQGDSMLSLDDFIAESFKQFEETPAKCEPQPCSNIKKDEMPILFDYSTIFMENSMVLEETPKPTVCPPTPAAISSSESDKTEATPKIQYPKARITKCLSNVKSSSFSKKLNSKKSKLKRAKKEPVLITDPATGKQMRPLDFIKLCWKEN